MEQRNASRTTNYLFVFGDNRDVTYSVQSSNIADLTLGETLYGARPKDLFVPSNKIDTAPLIIQFLLSEDHREWLDCYKWMLQLKNAKQTIFPGLARTCELTSLDSQNQPSTKFIYKDCFITNISAIEYTSLADSTVLTFDATLRYNQFDVVTADGEIINEQYGVDDAQ